MTSATGCGWRRAVSENADEQIWTSESRNFAEAKFRPSEIHRLYKTSTWNVAPPADIAELARHVDYVFVGVGG